jgi:ferrous-iron efflux pump FieF
MMTMPEAKNARADSPDLALRKRAKLMRLAAYASMAVGGTLALLKGVVWLLTGSVTMLASMTDSLLDLFASVMSYMGVRTALQPPDDTHRFGHGKAEALAALAQGAVMLGSAAFIILQSVLRLADPQPVMMAWTGMAVSAVAIILTLGLVLFQRHVIARSQSVAITADHLHYTGDLLLNLSVMVGLAVSAYGGLHFMDALFGIGIGVFIGYNAWGVAKGSIDMLMDREMASAEREAIFNIVLGNRDILGLHDLKTRKAGIDSFIQLHIEISPHASLHQAHLAAIEAEAALSERFPDAEIIIKIDPIGFEKPNLTMKELD